MDYNDDVIRGMIKTIIDGIKDSDYQLKYAHTAKNSGHHDIAALHIEEAKRRLSGTKEWYDRAKGAADGHNEAVTDALMGYYKDWYREIMDKVARFEPR